MFYILLCAIVCLLIHTNSGSVCQICSEVKKKKNVLFTGFEVVTLD